MSLTCAARSGDICDINMDFLALIPSTNILDSILLIYLIRLLRATNPNPNRISIDNDAEMQPPIAIALYVSFLIYSSRFISCIYRKLYMFQCPQDSDSELLGSHD